MQASNRMTIVERPEYRVELEYNEQYVILHLPKVEKFTKSVYQDMQIQLDEIRTFTDTVGYDGLWVALDPQDKTLNKFVQKMGFNYLGNSQNLSVYEHRREK